MNYTYSSESGITLNWDKMNPRKIFLWLVVYFSLCSMKSARPSGTDKKHEISDSHGTTNASPYQSRMGLSQLINKVRKHSNDRAPLTLPGNTVPKLNHGPNTEFENNLDREAIKFLEDELWSRIEIQLRQMENTVMGNVDEKISRLNNSVTIDFLYNVYHYLIEEVEIGKQIGEMRAGEIEKVRRISTEQGKDIEKLEKTLNDLRAMVNGLHNTVEELKNKQAYGDTATNPPPADLLQTRPTRPSLPGKPQFPIDCQAIYELGGMKYEGDYYMNIQPYLSEDPIEAHCRVFDKAGWLVIQRRMDGSEDFYRDWQSYKKGFGDIKGEFWFGNDRIYQITNQGDYMLRIQMTDFDGRKHNAEYDHFRILDEDHHYQMHVHNYRGNAGDSLTASWNNHNGQKFSTFDNDNDDRFYDNCAERFHGAWWFKSCFESHLNGIYYHEGMHQDSFRQNGIQWNTVGHHYSLRSVIMMIKPNRDFQPTKDHDIQVSNKIQ